MQCRYGFRLKTHLAYLPLVPAHLLPGYLRLPRVDERIRLQSRGGVFLVCRPRKQGASLPQGQRKRKFVSRSALIISPCTYWRGFPMRQNAKVFSIGRGHFPMLRQVGLLHPDISCAKSSPASLSPSPTAGFELLPRPRGNPADFIPFSPSRTDPVIRRSRHLITGVRLLAQKVTDWRICLRSVGSPAAGRLPIFV